MKKVKITLEVLTPMFSFGESNKKKSLAEFRITEIKALMRSTFRELYYFKSLEDMKEKEAALFGNSERKSPISFKAKCIKSHLHEQREMLPHKTLEKDKFKICCLDMKREISFYMIVANNLSLEFYINLLVQASIIGSLGKRSRKGFGSFKIINIKDDKNNSYDKFVSLLKKNPIDILKNEESSINKIRKVQNSNIGKLQSTISFDDLNNDLDYPYAKKITLLKLREEQKYLGLLKDISQLTHDRLDSKKDKDFTYRIDRKINRNILGNCKGQIKNLRRYASPIYVSFLEHGNSRYLVIKELNYNYILGAKKLDIISKDAKIANKNYMDTYIEELIKIGKGNK